LFTNIIREMSVMAKAIGIDLGTTHSVAVAWEGAKGTVVQNAEGGVQRLKR
jgi:molecular chaperone DnaK (HSP70)